MDGLTSLDGLSKLETIGGLYLRRNDALSSLAGAGAVSYGELPTLVLEGNPVLETLDPLASFTSTAELCVISLARLPLIDSLAPLASMCPGASLDELTVFDLPLLTTLDGIVPGPDAGLIQLTRNDALVELGALAPLETAEVLRVGSWCPEPPSAPGGNVSLSSQPTR